MKAAADLSAFIQRFKHIRAQTEKICLPLLPEDTVVQPIVDVSPPKWHLAHTSWFFETFILVPNLPNYQVFNPVYSFLFNSYYNSLGSRVQRDQRGTLTRPPLSEIYAYRAFIDDQIVKLVTEFPERITAELAPILELGLQHEQQHQELLITDIKYILSTNPLLPAYQKAQQTKSETSFPAPATFLPMPAGFYTIGHTGEGFCFDNELNPHKIWLPDFAIQNRTVTNGEYLEFMQAGGYQDFRYWLGEGFELCQTAGWEAPLYWIKQDEKWCRFTLTGLEPINKNAPVTHISFYEAAAYAQWAGKRLLTEQEWEAASQMFTPQLTNGNFLESGLYDPVAVSATTNGLQQLTGNTWEWTYSAYLPYPGFETAPGALGEYNGKFMINQMVLRGGSCATPASHIRTTYRNFFHPDKRWQFTGIRLADK